MSPVPVYVRAHNLLTTGDGTPALKWGSTNAYTEDAKGNPIYNWNIVDSIFDTYIKRGMKPLAQIGFMPEALSTKPEPYQHNFKPGHIYGTIYTGWAYPPNDYNKWRELIYQWVKHCVERYGKKEVESWYWEVWNEPDIGYWKGTQQEFFKTYDYAADGARKALPTIRFGGCDATGGSCKDSLPLFLNIVLVIPIMQRVRSVHRLTSYSFHAKGQPRVVNGNVTMNVGAQMRNIRNHFRVINEFPADKEFTDCDR